MNKFEEVRNKLQLIAEMLNRMPLEHSKDVFAKTASELDDLLANVTPDMDGEEVVKNAQPILKVCEAELQKQASLTPEQNELLQNIQSLH